MPPFRRVSNPRSGKSIVQPTYSIAREMQRPVHVAIRPVDIRITSSCNQHMVYRPSQPLGLFPDDASHRLNSHQGPALLYISGPGRLFGVSAFRVANRFPTPPSREVTKGVKFLLAPRTSLVELWAQRGNRKMFGPFDACT